MTQKRENAQDATTASNSTKTNQMKTSEEELDEYVLGVLKKSSVTFELNGTWGHPTSQFMKDLSRRQMQMTDMVKFLGIEWWTYKREFEVELKSVTETKDENGELVVDTEWQPKGPVKEHRPEWWRRWGHKIVSRIPGIR